MRFRGLEVTTEKIVTITLDEGEAQCLAHILHSTSLSDIRNFMDEACMPGWLETAQALLEELSDHDLLV